MTISGGAQELTGGVANPPVTGHGAVFATEFDINGLDAEFILGRLP